MDLLQQIIVRAKAHKQRIVLPEAEEERTLKAADKVLSDDIADLILIGNPTHIKELATQWNLKNIDKATIIDPQNNPKSEEYAEKLAELRKKKGMTIEQARDQEQPLLGLYDYQDRRGRWTDQWSLEHYRRHAPSCASDYQMRYRYYLCEWRTVAHYETKRIW